MKESVQRQKTSAADEQTVGDVEVGPDVAVVTQANPISHGVNRFAQRRVKAEAESVVKISEDAPHHQRQGNIENSVLRGLADEQPNWDADRERDGKQTEERDLALAHSEQRALVERRFDANQAVNDPPDFAFSWRAAPRKNKVFCEKVGRTAGGCDQNKCHDATSGNDLARIIGGLRRNVPGVLTRT